MSDYIERDKIGLTDFEIIMCNGDYKEGLKMLLDKIESIPAADVRPVVRGWWRKAPCHETDEAYTYVCPFCRWQMIAIEPMNYCPNCGADLHPEVVPETK